MRTATAFVYRDNQVLLLRRSRLMRNMSGLWAAISGVVEGPEDILYRAYTEVYEETGITDIYHMASCLPVHIPCHDIVVYPFLFGTHTDTVLLNWENDMYRWVRPADIISYRTVPFLDRILFCLFGVCPLAWQHDIDTCSATHGTWDVVSRMLPRTGVYQSGFLRIYR